MGENVKVVESSLGYGADGYSISVKSEDLEIEVEWPLYGQGIVGLSIRPGACAVSGEGSSTRAWVEVNMTPDFLDAFIGALERQRERWKWSEERSKGGEDE